LFGGAAGILIFAIMFFTNRSVRTKLANIDIGMPLLGPWLSEQDAARWASLCGAMLSARVGLLNALTLAAQSSIFTRRKQRALKMVDDIQSGVSMPDAIARAGTLPGTSLNLITVGDKTGKLAEMMQAVAKLHDEACKRKMKQVMTLIEPLAILVVGVLIGIMILGVVLAITASTDMAL
jgi:general secretion pathway protein F/type IV pilus assembly protein PilC